MRKIIVYIATSADGFISRSDGSVDWLDRPRPKGNYGMDAFYKTIDTTLWGRKTYDMALDFQKKAVSGTAFDTSVKNYVFTRTTPQSHRRRAWSSWPSQSSRSQPVYAGKRANTSG